MTISQGNGCSLTFFPVQGGGGCGVWALAYPRLRRGKKPVVNYQKNRLKVEVLKVNFVGKLFQRGLLPV